MTTPQTGVPVAITVSQAVATALMVRMASPPMADLLPAPVSPAAMPGTPSTHSRLGLPHPRRRQWRQQGGGGGGGGPETAASAAPPAVAVVVAAPPSATTAALVATVVNPAAADPAAITARAVVANQHSSGAIEFTALGRLIVNGGSFDASGKSAGGTIAGTPGLPGDVGFNGSPGAAGQVVSTPAGNGGNGGYGGHGGHSGDGGAGAAQVAWARVARAAPSSSPQPSSTLTPRSRCRVAPTPPGCSTGPDSGRTIIAYNHAFSGQLTPNPQAENGPVLTLPGMVPEASQASPYISGGPTVPTLQDFPAAQQSQA